MIAAFVVGLAALVAGLEFYLARWQMRQLVMDYAYDKDLAEPGENVTITVTVKNTSRLPVFYVGLSLYITEALTLRAGEGTVSSRLGENRVSTRFLLGPHRLMTLHLHVTAPDRGRYLPGKYFLETGDYLGFLSETKSVSMDKPIVFMPRPSENPEAFQTLAGYLGDRSVRRFIFEDPVLTVGTRDYTGSEPMKAIAWNQTARAGRMQVYVYDHTVEADTTVILNFENGSEEVREECLRLTRSVCEKLEADRVSYAFYTNADIRTPREDLRFLPSGLGRRHFCSLMYGCGQSNLHQYVPLSWLIREVCRTRKANHGCILITPPLNPENRQDVETLRAFSDCDICVLTAREPVKEVAEP